MDNTSATALVAVLTILTSCILALPLVLLTYAVTASIKKKPTRRLCFRHSRDTLKRGQLALVDNKNCDRCKK